MRKNQNGYIVVEFIGSFIIFVFFMVSIISLINVVVLQARVHYALTQTASELSMYSYVIEAIGLSDSIKSLDETGTRVQGEIDSIVEDINTIQSGATDLFNNLDAVIEAVGDLSGAAGDIIKDPKGTFVDVVRYGLDSGKNYLMAEFVIEPMILKYLKNGDIDGDTYLEKAGVKKIGNNYIDLLDSKFINSNGDIVVVANYSIKYIFGALPLPFGEIKVQQTAKTKAWLGGVGEGN